MEKKISLRVSDEDLEIIDSFIDRHEFSNRSEFLREAALEYIDRHSIRKNKLEVPAKITLPKKIKNNIHYLINLGHWDNWEQAIEKLVKESMLDLDVKKLEDKYKNMGEVSNRVESMMQMAKEQEQEYMKK